MSAVRLVEEVKEYEVKTDRYPYALRVVLRGGEERVSVEVKKGEILLLRADLMSRDLIEEAVALWAASQALEALRPKEEAVERGG
jgi:hypothetical protein